MEPEILVGITPSELVPPRLRDNSAALDALPRGREPSPPGERFRRTVLAAMPDIQAMELVDPVLRGRGRGRGDPHPIGIFLGGCRECLGEWETQASHMMFR